MRKRIAFLISVMSFTMPYGHFLSLAAEPKYPTRPIEMMVGYAPGGGTDLGARMIAGKAKEILGEEIVIGNKPGASGRVAMTILSKAKPDGYTLGAATDTSIVFSPHTEKVSYKPLDDFTFIIEYGTLDTALCVLSESPFRSFKDIFEFARNNPDKLTIGTVGGGGSSHVILKALIDTEGFKARIIPFKGAGPNMTALLGGHIMAASVAGSGYAPFVASGKVRLLAMYSPSRSEEYPEVPTLMELGYPLEVQGHYLISGPKNMDKSIVKKLEKAFKAAIDSPDYKKLMKNLAVGTENLLSGEELKKALIGRSAMNREIFKRAGIKTLE